MKKLKLWTAIIFLSIPVLAWAVAYKGSTLESTGNTTVGGALAVTGQSDFTGALHSSNIATFQTTTHLSTATFVSGIHGSGQTYLDDLYLGGTHRTTWPAGLDFTAPGPIGGTTPDTVDATTVTAVDIVATNQITLGGTARSSWPTADTAGILVNASDIQALAMALQESHGIEQLLMEEGFKGSFNASTTRIDTVNSTGYTFIPGGASTASTPGYIRNTAGATGQTSNIAFTTESDYIQQEWTKTNQSTSFIGSTNGSTHLTLSSGSFPTNFANGRITLNGGTTWYDIESVWGEGAALTSAYTGATGNTNDWTGRMSEFSGGTVRLSAISGGGYSADLTAGKTMTASSQDTGSEAGKSIDDTNSTRWWANAAMPNWLKLDFGAGATRTITQYTLQVNANNPSNAPSAWTFAGSNDDSDYTTIDTQTGLTTGWTADTPRVFNSFSNSTAYRYYKFNFTNDLGAGNGVFIYEMQMMENAGGNAITEYVSASPTYASRIATSAWSDINSLARTETLNSQNAWYWLIDNPAASYGAGTTAKIWNASGSVWRNIARNNGGTWQYNNDATNTAAESWSNATVNDLLFAVSKAISMQANNQMTGAQMAGVADGNLTAPASSLVLGVTLRSVSTSQNPSVDNIAAGYDSNSSALDLRTSQFLASAAPSTLYGFVAVKETSGTPTYTMTCNGGSAYNAITMSEVIALADGRSIKRGTRDTSGDSCTADIRLKVTVPAGSDFEISGIGLQGRQ
ncbi:MAG: discoidin domain-containing protein [Nitrospinae bacterium]|nr:discoidin domain-containing protein [Nitrospinota bacterium]